MIDTQAIRKKIIDLAIKGSLTTNDPTELAQKIPQTRKNTVLGDAPFVIPANWQWISLGWVLDVERGGSPRPIKEYLTEKSDGISWIKIGDVEKDGKYIERTKERIKPEGEKKSRRVYPGDFLLTNSMSFGRPYISRIEGCIHDGWLVLRNVLHLFDVDFLYYLLSSNYAFEQFTNKASGSTVDNLNIEKVATAIVPLPPIEEQKRIVEKIEIMLPALNTINLLQSQYQDNLATLKSKIIDASIQGKLTEQLPEDGTAEELYQQIQQEKLALEKAGKIKKAKPLPPISDKEKPFDIPENWKWVRLGDFYSFTNGTASRGTPGGSPHPVLRLADLTSGKIKCDNIRSIDLSDSEFDSHKLLCNDLVFVRVNGSRDRVATAYRYSEDDEISYCDHLFCGHSVSERINPDYIVYVFGTANIRAQLEPEIKTTAGQNTISQNPLKSVLIPLPPLAEQKRIVAKLEELLPLCEE